MQTRVKFAVLGRIDRDFALSHALTALGLRPQAVILAFDNAQSRSIRPRAANFTFVCIPSLSPLYA